MCKAPTGSRTLNLEFGRATSSSPGQRVARKVNCNDVGVFLLGTRLGFEPWTFGLVGERATIMALAWRLVRWE